MGSSDFQQNKPQRCKIGIKDEVNSLYFGDHNRTCIVISKKKKSSPCFSISVRPAASTVFPNLDLRVKNLPTPGLDTRYLFTVHTSHCGYFTAAKTYLPFHPTANQ